MSQEDVPPGWIRKSDVDALKQLFRERLAELGRLASERAAVRITAGDDPETAIAEEIRQMLIAMDQLDAAFRSSLDTRHS